MHPTIELPGRLRRGSPARGASFFAAFCWLLLLAGCRQLGGPAARSAAETHAAAGWAAPSPAVSTYVNDRPAQPPTPSPTPPSSIGLLQTTENILIMGIDQRPNDEAWRTDTIMVLALDRPNKRLGVVNVPRDLYVDIPGFGQGKINEADYFGESSHYPGGGPALLERVLTETLDLPAQHYVRVKMEGLVQLVDALGGVTVTLDCPLYERTPLPGAANGLQDWNLPAGQVHLDGEAAKKFATYRYVSSDFGRARRQQQLIWAIRNRALGIDIIPRIPALWSALQNTFETDLKPLDVAALAGFGIGLGPENVHGVVFSLDALAYDWSEKGASILVVKDREQLNRELAGLFDGQALFALSTSQGAAACPAAPTAVPTFTPIPTATITAAVALSGTLPAEATGTPEVLAPSGDVPSDGGAADGTPPSLPTAEPILTPSQSDTPAPG